ncbi:hypothetical protein DH2020_029443 [Rehmannia glutinosa]|uniref:Dolichyl-diphosphooligosaccharide--protein glycosyltransferase 48 kDa subunit n=1 Tax=Rehmannia glutinosa TaxID=99300 RepID=A0ABR0VNI3_REHGL
MFGKLLSTLLISFHLFAILCASFSEENPTDRRVLVLLDDFAIKSSHSLFFKSLETRGFDLDFKLADDPKLALQRYGKYMYDAVILFSPTIDRFGGSIDAASLLEFVDSGHDLILAADASASELIREIAVECGVDFDERIIHKDVTRVDDGGEIWFSYGGSSSTCFSLREFILITRLNPGNKEEYIDKRPAALVIDHTSYAVSETEGDHTLIASDDFIQSEVILGSTKIEAPALFKGIGHSINPANNLVLTVLSASPAAYSANPKSKLSNPPTLTGSAISLVSIVQARNNARILISGSSDLEYKKLELLPRQVILERCSSLKEGGDGGCVVSVMLSGTYRRYNVAVNVKHHKVGEKDEPSMYRIKDDLDYSVEVYEWSGTSWEPYLADDLQVQFYMMSPYVLKTLSTDQKGLYYTSFKVPDVYGVFQFKVEYQRLGYTSLSLSKQMGISFSPMYAFYKILTQIPVRPFRHNEYERFIPAAYPYYGASFSMQASIEIDIIQVYEKSLRFVFMVKHTDVWFLYLHHGVSVHKVAANWLDGDNRVCAFEARLWK